MAFFRRSSITRQKSVPDVNLHELLDKDDKESLATVLISVTEGRTQLTPIQLSKALEEKNDEGQGPIHRAMKSKDSSLVKMFLKFYRDNKLDINTKDKFGYSPLHCLCMNDALNDADCFREILSFENIKSNCRNDDDNTPLHFLCQYITSPDCTELADMLVKNAGKKIVNAQNADGETPLHKAIFNPVCRLLYVDFLIANGANPNIQSKHKQKTALHYAVHLKRKDLLSTLILAGTNSDLQDSDGKTACDIAVALNWKDIFNHIQSVVELVAWGKRVGLLEYMELFVKEELYLDVLKDIQEYSLEAIGIKTRGARLKIMAACKRIGEHDWANSMDSLDRMLLEECHSENGSNSSKILLRKRKESGAKTADVSKLIINKHDLEFTKRLGEGTSGRVFRGLYKKSKDVAIKVLKDSKGVSEFEKEFFMMSSVESPYLIKFFGVCLEPHLSMVMEYCSKGSLYDYMQNENIFFDWNMFFRMSLQMCKGIACLHDWTPPVLHRDLKSLNLLVNQKDDVVLADFGLSRFSTDTQEETLKKTVGTVCYAAPEVFLFEGTQMYTTHCDIYSCAMILWELVARTLTGTYKRPYEEYPNCKFDIIIMGQVCEHKLRPTIPEICPPGLRSLIEIAWSQEQESRPTADELVQKLEEQRALYELQKEDWNPLLPPPRPLSKGELSPILAVTNQTTNS